MDDKKKDLQTHPDLGDVGKLGEAGDLGANAAGAERPTTAPAAPALTLEPAKLSGDKPADPKPPLVKALIDAGFTVGESEKMAASAIEEIAARKGK
jgi:hypothetical protein